MTQTEVKAAVCDRMVRELVDTAARVLAQAVALAMAGGERSIDARERLLALVDDRLLGETEAVLRRVR